VVPSGTEAWCSLPRECRQETRVSNPSRKMASASTVYICKFGPWREGSEDGSGTFPSWSTVKEVPAMCRHFQCQMQVMGLADEPAAMTRAVRLESSIVYPSSGLSVPFWIRSFHNRQQERTDSGTGVP